MTLEKDQLRKTAELQKLMRDPAAVLALIAENERNQRMLLAACMDMGSIGNALDADMNSDGEALLEMVVEIKTERDQFKAENEALRKDADIGRLVFQFFDRMDDPADSDPLEKSAREFLGAVSAAMGKGEQP